MQIWGGAAFKYTSENNGSADFLDSTDYRADDNSRGLFPFSISNEKELSDMKQTIYAVLVVTLLTSFAGCLSAHGRRPTACVAGSCAQAPENCASCDCGNCQDPKDPSQQAPCRACGGRGCRLCRGGDGGDGFVAGPPAGTVAYPYYTTRGPRDFLARNPQSIGP